MVKRSSETNFARSPLSALLIYNESNLKWIEVVRILVRCTPETPQPRMSSERAVKPISPIAQQASLSMEELLYDEDMMEEAGMRDVGDLTEEEQGEAENRTKGRPTSHCLTRRTMK